MVVWLLEMNDETGEVKWFGYDIKMVAKKMHNRFKGCAFLIFYKAVIAKTK